jgi:hypothetical protein
MSPIIDPSRGIAVSSFAQLDANVRWFRELLASHQVIPSPTSDFERSLQAVENLAKGYRKGIPLPPDEDLPLMVRETLGTDYLIKAIHRTLTAMASALATKWNIFGGPDVCLTRDAPSHWNAIQPGKFLSPRSVRTLARM